MDDFCDILETLCRGEDLPRTRIQALFARIIDGDLGGFELAALLAALKAKGETPDEIAGAAEALRAAARPFPVASDDLVDTCGTGGDGKGTVNISTAVAVLAASMGLRVAKHGNRSVSSRCGSADVLEAAGVVIDADPDTARRCLDEVGICFLFAPQYHAGMRHAMPVRRALGVRTIFNVLGPLVNPARPRWQVVGVYAPELCVPVAATLGLLGVAGALVVHGGGLDELALHAPTTAALWRDGKVEELTIDPAAFGFPRRPLSALSGGEARENARWLAELLAGRGEEAHEEAVALNTGGLLWTTGRAASVAEGAQQALDALRAGGAADVLRRWAEASHGAR